MELPGEISCSGYCEKCGTTHRLPFGNAFEYAHAVMEEIAALGRLDYRSSDAEADPRFSLAALLPGDRGHMFGVMECLDGNGEIIWLRAFSSLAGGVREIPGWVTGIVDRATFEREVLPEQQRIKELTAARDKLVPGDPRRETLKEERREISRALMPRIHDLYHFVNFRGESRSLRELFPVEAGGGIPGGVGDCCAPKLLQHAAKNDLRPISLAEFYWGGENRSGRKKPGQFFAACSEKCAPVMGFLLCGLNARLPST